MRLAPRSSSAREASPRNGCASRNRDWEPRGGTSAAVRIGRNRTCPIPNSLNSLANWSSTTSASAPTTSRLGSVPAGSTGASATMRGETSVFALRERRLDAAAGIGKDAHARGMAARLPRRRALQVDLDDLGRAGADEEKQLDVGAALQQPGDDAVEFVVDIGDPREIALFQNGGGESRLGEDHDAGGRLDEMGAGARADDEKERVADLAMQPDDAGQAAEHFVLRGFMGDASGRRRARSSRRLPGDAEAGGACKRAARSFRTNCAALTT